MAKRRPQRLSPIEKLLRSDGALCVTFVNTGRRRALATYEDLLAWGVETRALAAADAQRLTRAASEHPGNAAGVARRALALCGRLERILVAVAEGRQPAASDFGPFNSALRAALAFRQLVPTAGGHEWTWGDDDEAGELDRVLWPVLLSAGELLASQDRHRVRQCPREGCGLLFLARGAGKPRKWCSRSCRTRTATRKHYVEKIKPRRERILREIRGQQHTHLAGFGKKRPAPGED